MTMTRQHFALIAETIAGLEDSHVIGEREREFIAARFASQLSNTNPNFNRARFLRACGVDDA